jgi:hypothetical protein
MVRMPMSSSAVSDRYRYLIYPDDRALTQVR